jgi:hypothetical protein
MDEGEPGDCEHGFGQTCDTANDIQADADGAAERTELVGKTGDIRRCVQQLAVDLHDAVGVDGSDPMNLLGDIDPNTDPHGAPRRLKLRHPARAVVALHSDGSQSLISSRGEVAVSGDLPREPSSAANMKTIPTPPPRLNPGMPGLRRQLLLTQRPNGRAP